MSRPAKRFIKWVIGIGVGVLFIWLAAADWPIETLFAHSITMHGTVLDAETWRFDMLYLLPYFGILSAIHFLRVLRWSPLLRPMGDFDFHRLNRVSGVGFMYLFILPLRLGELARPYLIADRGDIKMGQALGTIVVERVVDGLIVVGLLFSVLYFLPNQSTAGFVEIQYAAWLAMSVFMGAMSVLVAAYYRREQTLGLIRRLVATASPSLAEKITSLIESFLSGLQALPHPRYFFSFVGYSLIYWVLNGYGYYVLNLGFHGLDLPLLAGYAMMCCVVVGMMLPNPPANVGVFWFFLLKPLALYGVATGDPTATAFALTAWLGQLCQQTAFGLYFLARSDTDHELHFDAELASDNC